jgi:6-phosphogluconolactonase
VMPSVEVSVDVAARVATLVSQAADAAITERGAFVLAIAGGSLVKMLGAMASMSNVNWEKWHVAWVDERVVPHSDPESNYGGALSAWLSKVPIPAAHIYAIDEKAAATSAEAAAAEYERVLRALPSTILRLASDGLPRFDLLLLGFGPDGHICSLFPGHPLLTDASNRWVLPISDSPKPPPQRITLSLPAVNAARKVILVGTGEGKKEVVKASLSPGCSLPCALIAESSQPLWLLDQPAAALLPDAVPHDEL